MPSKMTHGLRRMIRSKPSEWLEDSISTAGRASAAGWHDAGSATPHTEGAIAIAIIRAELRRRAQRAARRQGVGQ